MEQQMNSVLLLLIFTGLVGTMLVVFFMLDRLNELHKQSHQQPGSTIPAEAFGGLSGKALWDAMNSLPTPGWDTVQIEALRSRYELVLQKHLELLFEDGKLDGREGFSMPVKSERWVPTLRGEIESWLPQELASSIYRVGHTLATATDEDRATLSRQLDLLGNEIFSRTGLPPHQLSALLMPLPTNPIQDSRTRLQAGHTQAAAAAAAYAEIDAATGLSDSAVDGQPTNDENHSFTALSAPVKADVIEALSLPTADATPMTGAAPTPTAPSRPDF